MSILHFPDFLDALHGAIHHDGAANRQGPRAGQGAGRLRKPAVGMRLTFTAAACAELAEIPAEVTYVWPRFRSGEYLVTLEYEEPVKLGKVLLRHIDAFVSELAPPAPIHARPALSVSVDNRQPAARQMPRSRAA